jgi:NADPH:quinone reductase-like Zn-dependent oxidoreductase
MKAAAIDRFGPPSVLTLHTRPVPEPGLSEVLIEVHAAGVGVWDASIRDGSWKPTGRPKFPLVPGTDGAGVVVAKGARVRRFDVGERVYASKYGFYAQYVAVDARQVGRVPEHLNDLEAGAAAITGLTALQGIDDALGVRHKETVLIFGASGAVGTLAVQFAKLRRAHVIATASGREASTLVRRLGADTVIDGRSARGLDELRKYAPAGIDAALVLASGERLEQFLDEVRDGGRVAYPNGVESELRRRKGIRFTAYDAQPGPREFERLERAATEAQLRVPIAEVYPLAKAADAHARLEEGHILGRIVLRTRSK